MFVNFFLCYYGDEFGFGEGYGKKSGMVWVVLNICWWSLVFVVLFIFFLVIVFVVGRII